MVRLAIIDDEPAVLRNLKRRAEKSGYEVEAFSDPVAAMAAMEKKAFNIVLSDLRMPGLTGFEVLERVKALSRETQVIIMTGYGSVSTAVDLVKQGAFYYLEKPFSPDQAMLILHRAAKHLGLADENRRLKKDLESGRGQTRIIGISRSIREMIKFIHKVAQVDCNVLIQGESGTGKELIARAIHDYSPRKDKPFVSFNCGAFSEDLVVNELFGHEKGAFTGALRSRAGMFERASGGTFLLDEIGEMPIHVQAKLLRVLQEREVSKVGGDNSVSVDVRIVATTNRNLRQEVEKGNFREDLFYRLNVFHIQLPPLRERMEDFEVLANHFVQKCNDENGFHVEGLEPECFEKMRKHSWPGNIRELENAVERAVVLTRNGMIKPALFDVATPVKSGGQGLEAGMTVADAEKELILKTLEYCNDNRTKAAQMLDISIRTLRNKLNEYQALHVQEDGW
ncbi:MAG: sigma-54-dependent transcriptional regulator [Fibrobacterota bacterium]